MDEKYFPEKIEEKWQKRWSEERAFEALKEDPRPKFYALEMLPYPSGFLHMGHVRNYSIGDALAWYKRLRGFNVMHPIGWDSFGQPAEQAAIKRGIQPREWTEENIAHMRGQMQRLGVSYDWSREIAAHRPDYYKWDQWFFLKMLERDLAYKRTSAVNWCPKEETVLSNEQSSGGICWRCGTAVTKKEIRTMVPADYEVRGRFGRRHQRNRKRLALKKSSSGNAIGSAAAKALTSTSR
jgi:leucyl-tRNA synthetase